MNRRNWYKFLRIKPVILAVIVALITICTYSPQLGADLDIRQDDHRIIFSGTSSPLHAQVRGTRSFSGLEIEPSVNWGLESDIQGGRFRPVTQILEIALPKLVGTEPVRWHILLLALTGVTCVALFYAGLGVFASARVAALFTLMAMLGPDPGPARTWYMMSTKAEAVGTLLVAYAILAACRAARGSNRRFWDGTALVGTLLAGLSKESFVLVVPAVVMLRVLLESRESRTSIWESTQKLQRLLVMYMGIFVAQLTAIALTLVAAGPDSYGGTSLKSASVFVEGFIFILRYLPEQSVWFIPVALSVWTLRGSWRTSETFRAVAPAVVLSALWIAPQVILYATRGGMWDHYWLPCVIGIAGINAAALAYLERASKKWLFGMACVTVIVWAGNGIRVNFQSVANFAERTHAHQEVLHSIAQQIPDKGRLLVVADDVTQGEYAFSWIFFLGNAGKPDTQISLYDTGKNHQGQFSTPVFFPFGGPLSSVPACQFDAIIFLNQPREDDAVWRRWYAKDCFAIHVSSRPQRYLSLRRFGWTTGEFKVTFAMKRPQTK